MKKEDTLKTTDKATDLRPETPREETSTAGQKAWVKPKLSFVEPKLTRHGELQHVTGGFFGSFTP